MLTDGRLMKEDVRVLQAETGALSSNLMQRRCLSTCLAPAYALSNSRVAVSQTVNEKDNALYLSLFPFPPL